MGLTFVRIEVANPANKVKPIEVKCLVDSGAVYTLIPRPILDQLGIQPHSRREFILANGEAMERDLGTAAFFYENRRGDSLVIFGEPGDEPLLGATTLESFGLILDPFRRELRPLPMKLAGFRIAIGEEAEIAARRQTAGSRRQAAGGRKQAASGRRQEGQMRHSSLVIRILSTSDSRIIRFASEDNE